MTTAGVLAAAAASLLGLFTTAPSAAAATSPAGVVSPAVNGGETALYSVGSKAYGLHVWGSRTTHLQYQQDGNFVLYCNGNGKGGDGQGNVIWATNLYNGAWVSPPAYLIFQTGGNLVIYPASGSPWATGTDGNGGDFAVVQNDGNFVVYRRGGGNGDGAIWASNTRYNSKCPETTGYNN
jgi:hypothetical protein